MSSAFKNINSLNKRKFSLLLFRYSKFLTIIFLLFIFILGYIFIIKPKYNKMKSISEELTEIKIDELQKLETYLERLRIFNQSYKKVSDLDRERINKIIPSENDYEDLVISVEDIIKNRGLILNSVTINSDEQASGASRSRAVPKSTTSTALSKGVKEIVLNLSVSETDYMTMKNLISDFEKNLRLMDIKNVSYSDGEGVSLVLSAYYYSL